LENKEKKTSHKFGEIISTKVQIIMNKGVNLREELIEKQRSALAN